jgi:hypothetical protein
MLLPAFSHYVVPFIVNMILSLFARFSSIPFFAGAKITMCFSNASWFHHYLYQLHYLNLLLIILLIFY